MNCFLQSFKRIVFDSHRCASLCLLFLMVSMAGNAQESTVTGTVTGENNTPLTGVTVTVKGTTRGTSTDVAGKFTISAAPTATLVFTSVGYANQEVAVGG